MNQELKATRAKAIDHHLNEIYLWGDQDECSLKHVSHGLASLITYDTWRETTDYPLPWGAIEIPRLEIILGYHWETVRAMMLEMGRADFYLAVTSLEIVTHLEFYLSGDWDYPRPEFVAVSK